MTPLRCAGCGCEGEAPKIRYQADPNALPVLKPVFDWHPDGRPALLCASCMRGMRRNRGRARYSKRRSSDAAFNGGRAMSKPRPANMFQHPQESKLAPMRDKLVFIEALTASGDLTGRELRVAILLTCFYSTTHGCSKPSMDTIAVSLGINKADVARAIKTLSAKGWFFVEHGNFRLGGKGHVNQYRPNPQRVASAQPFTTAAERVSDSAKGGEMHPKGGEMPPQRVAPAPTDTASYTESLTDTAILRMASRSQSDDAIDLSDPRSVMANLKIIERCLAGRPSGTWTGTHAPSPTALLEFCDEACEAYDSHTGDPIGGLAYRLAQDLAYELNNLAPTKGPPCATRSPTSPEAATEALLARHRASRAPSAGPAARSSDRGSLSVGTNSACRSASWPTSWEFERLTCSTWKPVRPDRPGGTAQGGDLPAGARGMTRRAPRRFPLAGRPGYRCYSGRLTVLRRLWSRSG